MTRVKDYKDAPEDIIALAEQADTLQDIKVLYESNGGKSLVKTLTKDVVNAMNSLAYGTEHREQNCARLRANLDLLKLLVNAKDNEEEADRIIAEALTS
jgi:hypothetical protein